MRISTVIPVYNGEKWIPKCIETLQAQTIFSDLEIIFINDGSTDHTKQMLDVFGENNKNVIVIHKKNGGVSAARNTGIDRATGEYITFLDVDDYLDSDYYETLLVECTGDAEIICGGFLVEYSERQVERKPKQKTVLVKDDAVKDFLLCQNIDPNVWNKIFKRELIRNIRFDSRFALAEDKYFIFQCLKCVSHVKVLPFAKYHYVMNESSVVHETFSDKMFDIYKVSDLIIEEVKTDFPQYLKLAESMQIDIECELCGEIYRTGKVKEYKEQYKHFRHDIRCFSIFTKAKYSTKKHIAALMASKVSTALYVFLKYKLKLKYKN